MLICPYTMMPKIDLPSLEKPNLITGVGHGHYHGPDMEPRYAKRKARTHTKMKKQSRRRNRAK